MSSTSHFENNFHKIYQVAISKSNFTLPAEVVEDTSSPLLHQQRDNGLETTLILAIALGKMEMVMYLLTEPLVIKYMKNITHLSAVLELILYTAVIHNQHKIITQLLEQKVFKPFENLKNTTNPFNCTLCLNKASQYAKQYNYEALEKWLNAQINDASDPVHSHANWR